MKTKSEALIEGPAEAVREDFDRAPVEPLPRDEDRPLFNDSWEAEAFVLGDRVALSGRGSRNARHVPGYVTSLRRSRLEQVQ